MLARHPRAPSASITFETYIYWSGEIGTALRRCAGRARARRRQGARAARLGRQPEDGRRAARGDARRRRRDPQVPPAALVRPRPAQQPHAPQAAGRRRPRRLHRRRRHRRRMDRPRAGPGALARLALPRSKGRSSRRCRRCSWTTGSRPPARCCTGRTTFPAHRSRPATALAQMFSSSPSGGSESMQLMYLLSITAAPSARSTCRAPTSCPTSWRCDALVAALQARRARAHHHARPAHRLRDGAPAPRARCGGRCSQPAPRSTSTSRRCSTARCWSSTGCWSRSARPTSTTARSALNDEANLNVYDARLRAAAGGDLRRRPAALAAHHLRRVAAAAAARKDRRAAVVADRLAAVGLGRCARAACALAAAWSGASTNCRLRQKIHCASRATRRACRRCSRLAPACWRRIGPLRAEVARAKQGLDRANAQLDAAR